MGTLLLALIRLHPASPVIWLVGGCLFALFSLFWLFELVDRLRERRTRRETGGDAGTGADSPFRAFGASSRRRDRLRIRRPGSGDP